MQSRLDPTCDSVVCEDSVVEAIKGPYDIRD